MITLPNPLNWGRSFQGSTHCCAVLNSNFIRVMPFWDPMGFKIDLSERICWKGEAELSLTLVEYKLLCLFLKNPGRILPRELILDRLWDGNGSYVDDNTLSVYIRRLRRKIERMEKAEENMEMLLRDVTERFETLAIQKRRESSDQLGEDTPSYKHCSGR